MTNHFLACTTSTSSSSSLLSAASTTVVTLTGFMIDKDDNKLGLVILVYWDWKYSGWILREIEVGLRVVMIFLNM